MKNGFELPDDLNKVYYGVNSTPGQLIHGLTQARFFSVRKTCRRFSNNNCNNYVIKYVH